MNRFFVSLTLAAAIFLAFFIGIVVGEYNAQPLYALLQPAFKAADVVFDRPLDKDLLVNSDIWNASALKKTGVTICARNRTFGDYTLASSGHAQGAELIDMDGQVVHEWDLSFREAWPNPEHVETPSDAALIYWRSLHLYPNGDLLASYETMGDVRGYGLVKMDADSRPLWRFSGRTGGHFAVDAEGFIYVIARTIRREPIAELPQIVAPFLDDELVVLSPAGKEVSRTSLMDRLVQKVGGRNLSFLSPKPRGALRVQSVSLVSDELAGKLPQVERGDILLSISSANLLAVLGRKDQQIKWVSKGPWKHPHHAVPSPKGDILLFDNRGAERQGKKSSVIRLDPARKKISWFYAGTSYRLLSSKRWSSVQALPNQNLLITETQGGRVFEITSDKQMVWEWISPHRAGPDGSHVACVWNGRRYLADDLDFKFNKGEKE